MTLRRPRGIDLVVDTSALIALMLGEPQQAAIASVLAGADGAVMSAGSLTEALIVSQSRLREHGAADLLDVVEACEVVVHPVDTTLARLAGEAWARYGRGRHRASLNYGDCFSYALARRLEVPLLCVGDDFVHTDLDIVALPSL
jgi:ribonuclease VapC